MKKKTNNNEHCMNTPWNDKYVMSTPCDCYILIYVQYYINVRINSTLICDISPKVQVKYVLEKTQGVVAM